MNIEVMKQALENVQEFKRRWWAVPPFGNKVNKATREAVSAAHSPIFQLEDALRTAIAEAESVEPVAWITAGRHTVPLRITPPAAQRQWVGLTEAEINEWDYDTRDVVMDIEKLLREKNT